MKRFSFLFFLALIFQVQTFAQDTATEDNGADEKFRSTYNLNLIIGLPQDLELPFLPPDAKFEGDWRGITRAQRVKGSPRIRFNAKKISTPKVATMVIMDRKKRKLYEIVIKVDKSNLVKTAQEVKSLLNDIEGITVNVIGSKVIVDGQVLLPKDIDRIELVVSQFKDQAASLVSLSPLAERKIAEVIEREINNPEITVRAVNKNFVIEGVADNADERQRAIDIAKTYVPDFVPLAGGKVSERKNHQIIPLLTVKPTPEREPPKLIQVVVHYVELKKNYNKGFRVQWTPNLDDGSKLTFTSDSRQPGGVGTTITGTISNLLPKLNWAKAAGYARVLQSQTVMVQNEEKGATSAVTKLPVPIVTPTGQIASDSVDVGIRLEVQPKIIGQRSDSIELGLDFEVGSYLGQNNNLPVTNKRSVTTKVTVRSGQSAAIGGLITSSSSTGFNQLPPGTSNNPIISIYASKDFQRDQSQFVTFVTPIVKASASDGAEKIKKKFRLRE